MQNPRLVRWKDPVADQGLLLFAQRLEESVFDYTFDSYKVRALNTKSRAQELGYWAHEVRNAGLPSGILTPMVQELAAGVRGDPVAKRLLGAHAEHFSSIPQVGCL